MFRPCANALELGVTLAQLAFVALCAWVLERDATLLGARIGARAAADAMNHIIVIAVVLHVSHYLYHVIPVIPACMSSQLLRPPESHVAVACLVPWAG